VSHNDHRLPSAGHRFRSLLKYILPLGLLAFTGCASAVKSIVRSEAEGLPNAPPPPPPAPSRKAEVYESPIPRWNSAYQGATSNQTPAEKKSLARAYHVMDVADVISEVMSGLLVAPNSSDKVTPLAISFCMSGGVPHRREKDWFNNVFSLEPGGLAKSIFEGRLRDRCEITYRRLTGSTIRPRGSLH